MKAVQKTANKGDFESFSNDQDLNRLMLPIYSNPDIYLYPESLNSREPSGSDSDGFSVSYQEAEDILSKMKGNSSNSANEQPDFIPGQVIKSSEVPKQKKKWEKLRKLWLDPLKLVGGSKNTSPKREEFDVEHKEKGLSFKLPTINLPSAETIKTSIINSMQSQLRDKSLSPETLSRSSPSSSSTSLQSTSQSINPLYFTSIREWNLWYTTLTNQQKYNIYKHMVHLNKPLKKPIPLSVAMSLLMFGWKVEGLCDPPPPIPPPKGN